MSVYLIFG